MPQPLPVDRLFGQKEYIYTQFKERNLALKKKLLIDGEVKIISKAERDQGISLMIPTTDGMDNWLN